MSLLLLFRPRGTGPEPEPNPCEHWELNDWSLTDWSIKCPDETPTGGGTQFASRTVVGIPVKVRWPDLPDDDEDESDELDAIGVLLLL